MLRRILIAVGVMANPPVLPEEMTMSVSDGYRFTNYDRYDRQQSWIVASAPDWAWVN